MIDDYSGIQWERADRTFDDITWMECETCFDGTIAVISNYYMEDGEAERYAARARSLFPTVKRVYAIIRGDDVELHYRIGEKGFERIRRITGYLVGTLDRFNDAKRAEESERVKHGTCL